MDNIIMIPDKFTSPFALMNNRVNDPCDADPDSDIVGVSVGCGDGIFVVVILGDFVNKLMDELVGILVGVLLGVFVGVLLGKLLG